MPATCQHQRVEFTPTEHVDDDARCADCGAELDYDGDGYNDKWKARPKP
jgi:hypothetical protein